MNLTCVFRGETLSPLPSGALHWSAKDMLVVSDLHLGKSERMARRGGALLPPYDTTETLTRLSDDIQLTAPKTVLCLGDSFDDIWAANALDEEHLSTIATLQAGRRWLWIEGNHDPGPLDVGGTHLAEHREGPLTFRHIAFENCEAGEVSGHYHPKARVRSASRPCFLMDDRRLMLPAYGCYTGGLNWTTPELRRLFDDRATAFLTGRKVLAVPVPRAA
ncbi:MAG: ligase-associated DNA damage response endonuclease PdeM [Boseongicola sp.]|nr:ligase-associated DNA damage response endonuclease PdeM [Boseongicola sp.]MDD9977529.1 ligase-associated DNA damage response endonuclease PdeM [Boseongicola sp.]